MLALFAAFYLVPAAFLAFLLWCAWRLIKCAGLPLWALRVTFVVLATLLFAPMVVPAGTIFAAWVPHGLMFLDFDLHYYVRFARYAFSSLGATAVLMSFAALVAIRQAEKARRPTGSMFALPAVAIVVTILAWQLAFPDREIPREITTAAVERSYGRVFDEVIALHDVEDEDERQQRADVLKRGFAEDAAVIFVALEDTGYAHTVYGKTFYFYQDDRNPTNKSCSGTKRPGQEALIRCSWKGGGADRRNVLRYRRDFDYEDERLELIVEFDFNELRDALTADDS